MQLSPDTFNDIRKAVHDLCGTRLLGLSHTEMLHVVRGHWPFACIEKTEDLGRIG